MGSYGRGTFVGSKALSGGVGSRVLKVDTVQKVMSPQYHVSDCVEQIPYCSGDGLFTFGVFLKHISYKSPEATLARFLVVARVSVSS